jgi:hypothetical protein
VQPCSVHVGHSSGSQRRHIEVSKSLHAHAHIRPEMVYVHMHTSVNVWKSLFDASRL